MEKKLITAQAIKSRFLGEDGQHKSMLELFEYHNEIMEKELHKDTMKHYRTTQRYLKCLCPRSTKQMMCF